MIERYMDESNIKYLRRGEKAWMQMWNLGGELAAVAVLQTEETVLVSAPVTLGADLRPSEDALRELLRRNGGCHFGRYAWIEGEGLFFQADVLLDGLTREQFVFVNLTVVNELRSNLAEIRRLVTGDGPPRLF